MFLDLFEHLVENEKPNPDNIFKSLPPEDLSQRRLINCTKNPDGTYSCDGDVDLSGLGLTKLPVRFKKVTGFFYCFNNKLTNLEGAPQVVGGYFDCSFNKLTTLEGAPQKVGKDFNCSRNNLTTLEGAPQKVGGLLYCSQNPIPERELKKTVKRSYLR